MKPQEGCLWPQSSHKEENVNNLNKSYLRSLANAVLGHNILKMKKKVSNSNKSNLRSRPKVVSGSQENKLGLLSYLGCVMKTPLSLTERATHTLTGPVAEAATARYFPNSVKK